MADPMRQPVVRQLMGQGWTFTITKKNHLKATHPEADGFLMIGGTPSDRRAAKNVLSKAERLLNGHRRNA